MCNSVPHFVKNLHSSRNTAVRGEAVRPRPNKSNLNTISGDLIFSMILKNFNSLACIFSQLTVGTLFNESFKNASGLQYLVFVNELKGSLKFLQFLFLHLDPDFLAFPVQIFSCSMLCTPDTPTNCARCDSFLLRGHRLDRHGAKSF